MNNGDGVPFAWLANFTNLEEVLDDSNKKCSGSISPSLIRRKGFVCEQTLDDDEIQMIDKVPDPRLDVSASLDQSGQVFDGVNDRNGFLEMLEKKTVKVNQRTSENLVGLVLLGLLTKISSFGSSAHSSHENEPIQCQSFVLSRSWREC